MKPETPDSPSAENLLKRVLVERAPDDQSLEDALVLTGMIDPERGQKVIDSIEAARLEALEKARGVFNREKDLLLQQLNRRSQNLTQTKESQEKLKKQLEEQGAALEKTEHEILEQENKRLAVTKDLIKRRERYPEKVLADNINKRTNIRKQILESLRGEWATKAEFKKELYDDAMKVRELNKDEYGRRIEFLKQRISRSQEYFAKIEEILFSLGRTGINRTSVGFLVWAGYAALPALGWFLGELLYKMYQGNIGVFQDLFSILTAAEGSLFQQFGFLWGLMLALVLPLVIFLALFAIYLITRSVMVRFNAKYGKAQETDRAKASRNKSWVDLWKWFPLNRLSLYTAPAASDRESIRGVFTIYLWMVIPFLLGAFFYLGLKNPDYLSFLSQIRSQGMMSNALFPWNSILFTYLGVVICMVITAFGTVYIVKVVQPRLVSNGKNEQLTILKAAGANLEIIVVALLILAATIVYDVVHSNLPSLPALWSPNAMAMVFIFVIANSVALGYGISFRGLYRDSESYKEEIQKYEVEMQRYSALPSIQEPDNNWQEFESRLKELEQEVNKVWQTADFYSVPLTSYPIVSYIAAGAGRVLTESEREGIAEKSQFGFTKYDALYESDLSAALTEAFERIISLRQSKQRMISQIEEFNKQLQLSSEKERTTLDTMDILAQQVVDVERRSNNEIATISREFMGILTRASNALQVGSILGNQGEMSSTSFAK
ncbi:MAG: hypothetical protein ABSF91_08325 [Bacteroidota bacterium]|jgi:hypothetical protein